MMEEGLGSDMGQVPALVERFTAAARRGTSIPILAKLTPNVARMSPAAEAALSGGADGLSAINTIKSLMAVNPDTYVSSPDVNGKSAVGGYSGNAVKPIALRFVAELGQNPKLRNMHLSGMGGVETWQDALEFMLLGAGSIQVTTAVMQYGYRIIEDLKSGLAYYLQTKALNKWGMWSDWAWIQSVLRRMFWSGKASSIRSLIARPVSDAAVVRFPAWMVVIRQSGWMKGGAPSWMPRNAWAVIFVYWYAPRSPSVLRESE